MKWSGDAMQRGEDPFKCQGAGAGAPKTGPSGTGEGPAEVGATCKHFPRPRVCASMMHKVESPRFPMYTTPSPIVTAVGPSATFRPRSSTSPVLNPVTCDTASELSSITSTLPVLLAGTHNFPVERSYAK